MSKRKITWTPELLERAKKALGRSRTLDEAARLLSQDAGFEVSFNALNQAFVGRGLRPGHYLRPRVKPLVSTPGEAPPALPALPPEMEPEDDAQVSVLYAALKRGPVSTNDLCNRLDLSPKRLQEMVDRARSFGLALKVENNFVALGHDDPGPAEVKEVGMSGVAQEVGKPMSVGVVSDLHAGSKYILRDQLRDCIRAFHERGIRDILVPGDLIDGVYRHSMFEQTHPGLEAQQEDLLTCLPALKDLRYWGISGNHDETFFSKNGVNICRSIQDAFEDAGRNDLRMLGRRSAFIRINGAVVHMWHPGSGPAYAKSYKLQKKCEGYTYIKPQIMLAGHWHQYAVVEERSIQAIACPTFQGNGGRMGSEFGNSLKNSGPAIGGLVLTWTLTGDGSIRDFTITRRAYYEREKPVEVMNRMDAEAVDIPPRR